MGFASINHCCIYRRFYSSGENAEKHEIPKEFPTAKSRQSNNLYDFRPQRINFPRQHASFLSLHLLVELCPNTTEEEGSVTGLDGFIANYRQSVTAVDFHTIFKIHILLMLLDVKINKMVTHVIQSQGRLPDVLVFSRVLNALAL